MDATADILNSVQEHAKNCIAQTSSLRENVVVPKMLIYNPGAGSLVESIQLELAELEDAFKQLHKLAIERHTHLSTVEVIVSMFYF